MFELQLVPRSILKIVQEANSPASLKLSNSKVPDRQVKILFLIMALFQKKT